MGDDAPIDPAEERRRLLRALTLSRRFHLYLVYCDRPRVAASVIEDIKRLVATERDGATVVHEVIDFGGLRVGEERFVGRVKQVLLALQTGTPEGLKDKRVHVVDASHALAAEREAWERFFWLLNPTREVVRARLEGELVLVMPSWMEASFRANAPDYWTIRSGSDGFWLTAKPWTEAAAPAAAERAPSSSTDDPIALRGAFLRALGRSQEALTSGRTEEATEGAREAVAAARTRWQGYPEQTEALIDLGDALVAEARALEAKGELPGALASARETVARGRELLARDPERVESHGKMVERAALEASLHARRDDTQEALRAQQEAVEHARAAHAADGSAGATRQLVEQLHALATIYAQHGKGEQARKALHDALPLLHAASDEGLRARVEEEIEGLRGMKGEVAEGDDTRAIGTTSEERQASNSLIPQVVGAPSHLTPALQRYWQEDHATGGWSFVLFGEYYRQPLNRAGPISALPDWFFSLLLLGSLGGALTAAGLRPASMLAVLLAVALLLKTWLTFLDRTRASIMESVRSSQVCVVVSTALLRVERQGRTPQGPPKPTEVLCSVQQEEVHSLEAVTGRFFVPRFTYSTASVDEKVLTYSVHALLKGIERRDLGIRLNSREDALFVAARLTAAVNHFRSLAPPSPTPPEPPSTAP